MTVKPKNARAYMRAAYTAALAATAGIAIVAGAPGIADAARVAPLTSHHGTWSITTPFTFTQSNAKFITHSTVSGCVTPTSGMGTFGWHIQIIWYDGGKNKVLWRSKEISSNGGRHCSPKLTVHAHLPKVYSQETLNCNNPIPLPCELSGTWSLATN
jgi:hypothetical protein